MTLKPVQRADILVDPMTADEISSFEFKRPELDKGVDKMLSSPLEIIKDADDLLPSPGSSNHSDRMRARWIRRMRSIRKEMDCSRMNLAPLTMDLEKWWILRARRIHTLIAKSGRQGLDVDIIQETFAFEDSVILEALRKLEKLNAIEWLDDTRVILSENLVKITGSTIDVYVEKVIAGGALVIVNEKWHARLNHYDYEGPRELLRKGSEFRVVGELYHDEGVFSLRVKQII